MFLATSLPIVQFVNWIILNKVDIISQLKGLIQDKGSSHRIILFSNSSDRVI